MEHRLKRHFVLFGWLFSKRGAIAVGVLTIALIGVFEIAVRALGLVSFPVYAVDNEIGYIPKPDQAGTFLDKNHWVFNDRSMGVSRPWDPKGNTNILLVGNSIVMGGDPFDQSEKVGPLIQKRLGPDYALWPIAAGGWTNVNESVYLNRNPDVMQATNFFVWEFMVGGLTNATPWVNDFIWPRDHPLWAGLYAVRRYLLPRLFPPESTWPPPTGVIDPASLTKFTSTLARLCKDTHREAPGILLLYPTRSDLEVALQGREWLPERPVLEKLAQTYHLKLLDVAADPRWNPNIYRADGIHPTAAGNVVLADIVSQALRLALTDTKMQSAALPQ
jgi:hypothetical protein